MRIFWVWTFLIVLSFTAQARVFDMSKETFGSYLRVSEGTSAAAQTAFKDATGANESFDKKVSYNFSGEFGFLWARRFMNLRLGVEAIQPAVLKEVSATDASGTELYKISSQVAGMVLPKVSVEFNIKQGQNYRLFFGGSYGQGTVTLKNSYAFTAAGQSAFSNIADYDENAKGTATLGEGFLAFENLLSDTTTFCFDLGYRTLNVPTFKFTQDSTTIQGAKAVGDNLSNSDGSDRGVNLGGAFLGLAFRFYL